MTTPTLPADWTLPEPAGYMLKVADPAGKLYAYKFDWAFGEPDIETACEEVTPMFSRADLIAAAQSAYAAGFRDGAMACAAECKSEASRARELRGAQRREVDSASNVYLRLMAVMADDCAAACERLGRTEDGNV